MIRNAEPSDHARVIDEWWDGRPMAAMLPKLCSVHFRGTSFVAEDDGALAGLLCGFRSQTHADEAYVHVSASTRAAVERRQTTARSRAWPARATMRSTRSTNGSKPTTFGASATKFESALTS